jgi:hypothetical protein
MAVKQAFEGQDDYTWDDFGDVDRSWDEWWYEKWESDSGIFQVRFSSSTFGTFSSPAELPASFSQSTFGTFSSPITSSASFSQTTLGTFSSTIFPLSQFSVSGNAIYANAALVANVPSLFTPSINVNFDPGLAASIVLGSFSVDANLNATFQTLTPTFETLTSLVSNANFGPASAESAISAFNTQLTTARFVSIADPFHLAKALQETRLYKIIEESRVLAAKQETRVNNIEQETRVLPVDQETRVLKIKRPGFTDNTTIPRVRGG